MRIALLTAALLAAAALAAAAGAALSPAGTLSIEEGRGTIEVKGQGGLLGRVERGTLLVVDLTPHDRFTPRINGVPFGGRVSWRGQDLTFYVPGGRYRVVVRGEGISLAARGRGVALLAGQPDAVGSTGLYGVGRAVDCGTEPSDCTALPTAKERVAFGVAELESRTRLP